MGYHEGELAMQRRAGVTELAERVSRIVGSVVPPVAKTFLSAQRFVITASVDAHGAVTASLLAGPPGFAYAEGERTVVVDCGASPGLAPRVRRLLEDIAATGRIGLLAIDLVTRRRMRLNGEATRRGDALRVTTKEVYSNCPRYIRPRPFDGKVAVETAEVLTPAQQRFITEADTFFLATAHPRNGADASHRGGEPGFVRVDSPSRLVWPDYPGNNMFNSLGNLLVSPSCGLLFVDFAGSRALQLRGTATVEGDAERRVVFDMGKAGA